MSKEDYIRKHYLEKPLKKKGKKKKKGSRLSLVERGLRVSDSEGEENDYFRDDDEPIVAGIVDERPELVKVVESYRLDDKWKPLGLNALKQDPDGHRNEQNNPKSTDVLRLRHDSDSDLSPTRPEHRAQQRHDSNFSPTLGRSIKRERHDSDSDLSPSRPQHSIKQERHDSNSDQSPSRHHQQSRHSKFYISCNATVKREAPDDLSPRRRRASSSDSDLSPTRHKSTKSRSSYSGRGHDKPSNDHNRSHHHRHHRHKRSRSPKSSDSDIEPVRRMHIKEEISDLSPLRQTQADLSPKRSRSITTESSDNKTVGNSGIRAGVATADQLRRDREAKRQKDELTFSKMKPEVLSSGGQQTVFRDRATGKIRDLDAENRLKQTKAAEQEKIQQKYDEWGKGLKQQQMLKGRIVDAIHEAKKPLARYKDDEDLDTTLKAAERAEDPMLAYLTKKPKSKKKASTGKSSQPVYNGPAPPPNRFGIHCGYRWDGVDRSNGFESKLFKAQAERKAVQEEAYKWGVEDM